MPDALFRLFEPWECGPDGYPLVWHRNARPDPDPDPEHAQLDAEQRAIAAGLGIVRPADWGVKHIIRDVAGHRCERCLHPFVVGLSGDWEAVSRQEDRKPRDGSLLIAETGRLFYEGITPDEVPRKAGIHWSRCDARCRHEGPARARVTPDRPWELRSAARAEDIQWAVAQGNEVQAAFRILTVHHLNGHKHDLRWWNLAALCQRCHLYIQRKVQMERIWPWEHSEWFQPHAAGWYAYAYLGEDLTREEALARMDELLALERAAAGTDS